MAEAPGAPSEVEAMDGRNEAVGPELDPSRKPPSGRNSILPYPTNRHEIPNIRENPGNRIPGSTSSARSSMS